MVYDVIFQIRGIILKTQKRKHSKVVCGDYIFHALENSQEPNECKDRPGNGETPAEKQMCRAPQGHVLARRDESIQMKFD